MDRRQAAVQQSLRRIVEYVDRHEPLQDLATKSSAVTLLREHIEEFDTLTQRQSAVTIGSVGATAERRVVKRVLWRTMDTIRCAADVARLKDPTVPPFRIPPLETSTPLLIAAALGMAEGADKCLDVLVAHGLQRSLVSDIVPLTTTLQQLVATGAVESGSGRAATTVLPLVLRSARKLVPLIYRQLEPAMTADLRAEWKQAAALGRTHRPNALPSGNRRRLPAASRKSI